ncbi:MAG: hypothetical protein F9K29_18130 [Hyphomicrobiaceae bacterium]|nr:MAG: hypothetical protein F9K29_18130 [Hyphomicrobiaceae bacterium]
MPPRFPLIDRTVSLASPEAVLTFRLTGHGVTARHVRQAIGINARGANDVVMGRAALDAEGLARIGKQFGLSIRRMTKPLSDEEARGWRFYLAFAAEAGTAWSHIAEILDLAGLQHGEAAAALGIPRASLSRALHGKGRTLLTRCQVVALLRGLRLRLEPEAILAPRPLGQLLPGNALMRARKAAFEHHTRCGPPGSCPAPRGLRPTSASTARRSRPISGPSLSAACTAIFRLATSRAYTVLSQLLP